MKIITATVTRGQNKGTTLKPHRFPGNYFLISKGGKNGNRRECAKEVSSEQELESWIQRGYGIRMSAPGVSPSLFMPKSLMILTLERGKQ